jgi:hypothetical protein
VIKGAVIFVAGMVAGFAVALLVTTLEEDADARAAAVHRSGPRAMP